MLLNIDFMTRKKTEFSSLETDRKPFWNLWRTLADYYMPKRYNWLLSTAEQKPHLVVNPNILDGTGTLAARVLASGMMNGITNPSSPWFRLRLANYHDDIDTAAREWLDEVERRMLLVLAESNFYNAMAVMYIDLVIFGTSSMLIYEDFESVIRCYNNALGEYYLGQDSRQQVNLFARKFTRKVYQVVEQWGRENCSSTVKAAYDGTSKYSQDVSICHIIEPNASGDKLVPKRFKFREIYWEEKNGVANEVLAVNGFNEMPGLFPRWELSGNECYGTAPGLDALGDVIQLQHETKRKGQSLDYMNRPHMLFDVSMISTPSSMLPGGQTFVPGLNNGSVGGKPAYQFTPPIGEMTLDIRDIQSRIKMTFLNDLFMMISELQTVRTATEIDARREEKLLRLGPVLERFENEALDPAIKRVYGIMLRKGLIPEPPPSIANADLDIQYVSMLAASQSVLRAAPTERFLQVIGNVASMDQSVLTIPNFEELLRDYARDTGVKAKGLNSPEVSAQMKQQQAQEAMAQKGLAAAEQGANAGKVLSETDVGGGANMLQEMLGG